MSDHPPRKSLTKREHIDLFIAQGGRCPICKQKLEAGQPRVEEHTPARALLLANGVLPEEVDGPKYRSIVHATPCAAKKTRGCEGESNKHSVADGDQHKVAKAARIARGGKTVRKPMPKVQRPMPQRHDPWGIEFKKRRETQP